MGQISIVEILATIAPLPILFPAIVGINRFSKASSAEKNVIALVIVAFISQVVATIMWWKTMNNLFISHYFTIVEGALLLRYFSYFFGAKGGNILNVLVVIFVALSLSEVLLSFPDLGVNAPAKGLESILIISLSLFTWRKIIREYTEKNLLSVPLFWINSAAIIYFSASILLFMFSESVLASEQSIGLLLWALHLFFMTVYYLLIGIGLWKITRR